MQLSGYRPGKNRGSIEMVFGSPSRFVPPAAGKRQSMFDPLRSARFHPPPRRVSNSMMIGGCLLRSRRESL
jgi:hypothetical protein